MICVLLQSSNLAIVNIYIFLLGAVKCYAFYVLTASMCYLEANVMLFYILMVLFSSVGNPIQELGWGSEVITPVVFSLALILS